MDISRKCIVCSEQSDDGISILGECICCECEKNIVNTDMLDNRYDDYVGAIRENIFLKKQ
jgi:Inhibitor of sigma-G Gin.